MFTVTIFDKSKNLFKTYKHIQEIKYFDLADDWVSISGKDILVYNFPLSCNYQLLSIDGNYKIDSSIIGTIEIEKEV